MMGLSRQMSYFVGEGLKKKYSMLRPMITDKNSESPKTHKPEIPSIGL
jgi:hypothetical protein